MYHNEQKIIVRIFEVRISPDVSQYVSPEFPLCSCGRSTSRRTSRCAHAAGVRLARRLAVFMRPKYVSPDVTHCSCARSTSRQTPRWLMRQKCVSPDVSWARVAEVRLAGRLAVRMRPKCVSPDVSLCSCGRSTSCRTRRSAHAPEVRRAGRLALLMWPKYVSPDASLAHAAEVRLAGRLAVRMWPKYVSPDVSLCSCGRRTSRRRCRSGHAAEERSRRTSCSAHAPEVCRARRLAVFWWL